MSQIGRWFGRAALKMTLVAVGINSANLRPQNYHRASATATANASSTTFGESVAAPPPYLAGHAQGQDDKRPAFRVRDVASLIVDSLAAHPLIAVAAIANSALLVLIYGAMFGWYRYVVDATVLGTCTASLLVAAAAIRKVKLELSLAVASTLVLLATVATGWFQHETLLGDYDSGNYAFRAAYLGRTGDFAPMFLPGYTVYLSALHHVGGFGLQQWGNALLLAGSLIMIVRIGEMLAGNKWAGIAAAAIFASHYTTLWFARQTLSDNFGLFFLMTSLCLVVAGIATHRPIVATFALAPASLVLLARPEGLLFLVAIVAVVGFWWWRERPPFPMRSANVAQLALVALLVIANVAAVAVHETRHGDEQYYRGYLEKALHLVSVTVPGVPDIETAHTPVVKDDDANSQGVPTYRKYTARFVAGSLYKYGLHVLFAVSAFGLAVHRKNLKLVLVMLTVMSPALLLIVEPAISWVHPWFMRHYWMTIVPVSSILAGYWVVSLGSNRSGVLAAVALVGFHLWMAAPILTLKDSEGFRDSLAATRGLLADRDALVLAEPQLKYVVDPLHYLFDVNANRPVSFLDVANADTVRKLRVEALQEHRTIYLLTRHAPSEEFPGIELADGRVYAANELRYLGGTVLDTRRLVFVVEADRYARPELIPPKPLTEGYGPIGQAVDQLPPRHVGEAIYRFHVFEVIVRPGTR